MKLLFTAIVNVVIIIDIVLLLLQQLHFPHRCIMDLRKFPLDSQVGNPCQKIVNNFRLSLLFLELKVFPKHNFRFKTIYHSQRHFTPPLKSITRIFPILENTIYIFKFWKIRVKSSSLGKYELYSPNFQNTRYISKFCHFRKRQVMFSKFYEI